MDEYVKIKITYFLNNAGELIKKEKTDKHEKKRDDTDTSYSGSGR